MATVVSYFLMAIAPHFFAQAIIGVTGDDVGSSGCKKVLVKVLGEGDSHQVFVMSDGDVQGANVVADANMVFAFAGDGLKNDGRSEKRQVKIRTIVNRTNSGDSEHGWLGVSLVNVQARNDGKDEIGVIITNVVDDSPADLVGLQAEDVVVSIDGQVVGTKISDLVKLVSANKPGDEIEIVVLRDGDEKAFTVTLGSRAEVKKFEWKFNTSPLAEIEENIHVTGKFLQRDDDGEWIFKDLGDLSEIEGLPANIKMLMPHSGSHMTKIFVGDDGRMVHTTISKDGVTISIEQEDDGPITVTRTDENGDETVETYVDFEEMQTEDEKAAEMFGGNGTQFEFKIDDLDLDDLNFDFKFDIDPEDIENSIALWMQGMEDFNKARSDIEFALLQLPDALRQTEVGGEFPEVMQQLFSQLAELKVLKSITTTGHSDLAKQSFEVRPNGMIEVTIRKGDSELIDLYENEDDLANRNPDLYKKYQDLRGEME